MSRVKEVSIAVAVVAIALLIVGVERAWFAAEPTSRGKTVTEWLDCLVLYDYQTNASGDVVGEPRSPERIARDPAVEAVLRLGPKATPILVQHLQERAQWDRSESPGHRIQQWARWLWDRIRHIATNPPAPEGWSEFQRARKNAAAFALLALGTNANAGFACFIEAYAAAPKHESVSRTRIPGPPVGAYPSSVTRLAKKAFPQRQEEIFGDILEGLRHSNAWCRVVAAECAGVFPERWTRSKRLFLSLLEDDNALVREATLGSLLLTVPYFHVVFTLPHELNPVVPQNQRSPYTLLLGTVAQTLLSFGRQNLKAELGLTLVLHTWSQTLLDHYHDARRICPRCGQRALVWVETVYGPARGPPTPDLFAT